MIYDAPEFEISVIPHGDGSPDTVQLTPVKRGGRNYDEEEVFMQIAKSLQSTVITAVMDFVPAMSLNLVRSTNGILQMNNINDYRHAHTEDLTLGELSVQHIQDIFERVVQYGEISIFDVSFAFWINPLCLQVGGDKDAKGKPKKGIYRKTIKTPSHKGQSAGCAAAAIVFSLAKAGYYGSSLQRNIGRSQGEKIWFQKSMELQSQLGWGDEVLVSQISDFVKHYPNFRIVVVDLALKSSKATDWKGEEYENNGSKNIIFLHYSTTSLHFSAISSIKEFVKTMGGYYKWCLDCSTRYSSASGLQKCYCNLPNQIPEKRKQLNCQHCGIDYSQGSRHICFHSQCKSCALAFENNTENMLHHRCPIFMSTRAKPSTFLSEPIDDRVCEDQEDSKKQYSLWVYDLESCLVPVEGTQPTYALNGNGYFATDGEEVKVVYRQKSKQVPNLVVYKNVFSGERKQTGDISEFLRDMLTSNDGRNIVLAHNGSGYDTRLIFEALITVIPAETQLSPLMRGTKFMRLQVGKTIFGDSMLHLSGSLSSLANDFLKGTTDFDLEKGEFPHFFNREEFKNYKGSIPGDEYYDLAYTVKDDAALAKHKQMKAKWEGKEWDAEKELLNYCINDVEILAEVVRLHHVQCMEMVGEYNPGLAVSPWHFTTAAGYMHYLFQLEMKQEMDKDEKDPEVIKRITQSNWAALEAEEHYFAKLALRGGRTEVRKFHYEGEISNFDVHSMYPSVQIGKSIEVMGDQIPLLYPVGTPHIEIHDLDYYPCNLHFQKPGEICSCSLEKKLQFKRKKLDIEMVSGVFDIHDYVLNFDGIIMVDVAPPKDMYHPLLPVFDEEKKKCLYSCEDIVCKAFASPMLKVAIKHGYTVTKIYRADRYDMKPSKWEGLLGAMYKIKYYTSKNKSDLTDEEQQHHKEYYLTRFNIDLDFDQCVKRPALKKSSKILINSPWGKHAESVDHMQSSVFGHEDFSGAEEFYNRIDKRQIKVKQFHHLTDNKTLFKYEEVRNHKDKGVRPNLHKGYLPCAVFVPMYGQLMMWNVLNQLGERVLMCDTDSVKYYSTGAENEYQVPPGNALGQWEDEGTLKEFVSIGLKCYGLRFANGREEYKIKGCSLKRSHQKLINFDSMKEILMDGKAVSIPQLSFDYKYGEGMSTREFLKTVKFDPRILKGNYDEDQYQLFPFGYERREDKGDKNE